MKERPRRRLRGPWEEYALAVLLGKGIEAVVDIGCARVTATVEEWRRHASGEAKRDFVERFEAALEAEPSLDDEELEPEETPSLDDALDPEPEEDE